MLTLTLMRHGKAEVGTPTGEDVDRPLAPRGERAAMMAGRVLIERGIRPEIVLCSPARRTRETLEGLLGNLPSRIEIKLEPDLYLAASDALLGSIQSISGAATSALLIGHNPGIHQLAQALVGSAAADGDLKTMQGRFPTSALAIFSFDAKKWRDVAFGGGRLAAFDLSARAA